MLQCQSFVHIHVQCISMLCFTLPQMYQNTLLSSLNKVVKKLSSNELNICKPNKAILFTMSLFNFHVFIKKKTIYSPNYNGYCYCKIYRITSWIKKIDHNILFKLKNAKTTIHKKVFGWYCCLKVSRPRRVGGEFFFQT